MKVIKDFLGSGGAAPVPFDIWYNGDIAVDSVTIRYKGSLCKIMDLDDIDHGMFVTFAGLATAMENVCGILEEDQPITDNYLPDDATYGVRYRKMTPIFPSTVIEAEYSQLDAAGTANHATGIVGVAGATTSTATITTADRLIGGWLYVINGDSAGYLYYISDNATTTITHSALAAAIATGDKVLIIAPPVDRFLDFDATYTGIKSQYDDASRLDNVVGISTWISAPGIGKTKLDREKHNGLKIDNAHFFHQFVIVGVANYPLVWVDGLKAS